MVSINCGSPNEPLAIGALNRLAKDVLERHFSQVWVKGELIALSIPSSGHWYFTLKDAEGQISCALFKYRAPQEAISVGTEVLLSGNVTLYEPRGQYQMIVETILPWGIGQRHILFEALKKKLFEEGLLDASRKKTLPRYPERIAIVSSMQAAGLQDVLVILQRRYPIARITIYPSLVQGDTAARAIISSLDKLEKFHPRYDVVMIVRGGGSPEDLWCFNDEALARRIATMVLPVITGIGHEIDITLADLVADVRAPTPSAAAEMVVEDSEDVLRLFQEWRSRMRHIVQSRLDHMTLRLDSARLRLEQKLLLVDAKRNRLKDLSLRAKYAFERYIRRLEAVLVHVRMRWMHGDGKKDLHNKLMTLGHRLSKSTEDAMGRVERNLGRLQNVWAARDPQHLLRGGWSWVENDQGPLENVAAMKPGSQWRLWVLGGKAHVTVDESYPL